MNTITSIGFTSLPSKSCKCTNFTKEIFTYNTLKKIKINIKLKVTCISLFFISNLNLNYFTFLRVYNLHKKYIIYIFEYISYVYIAP